MNRKAVLLLGSYGQTNLGDDLLMWNYLVFLGERGFEKIYVNASLAKNIPDVIKLGFPNIIVIQTYKTSLSQWSKIIRSVDSIVYGGGTIFKELYATTGRGRYSVIVRIMFFNLLARLLGARIYHLHIGIGVLKTWLGKFITRWALGAATLTVFRDKQSYKMAGDLRVPASKIRLANDGLFMNDRWQEVWQPSTLPIPENKYKRVIGINMLADIPDWVDAEKYIMTMRSFIKSLLDDGDFVVLVPFQHAFNPHNDHKFMQQEVVQHFAEYKNLTLLKSVPIEHAVSIFKQLDFFVGMRFHSLLLATSTATPFLAVAYDTKCWRFITENRYAYAERIEDISEQSLRVTFQRLLTNAAKVPMQLKTITDEQHKKGQECIDQILF